MKRIEVMAKMQEEAVAEEIIDFLREHNLLESVCSHFAQDRLDAVYGLAQYLAEDVADVKDKEWQEHCEAEAMFSSMWPDQM